TTVALRYPDGTYTVLRDDVVADGIDFTGYRNSYEEAIYDWYVTEYDLALPLYVEEWGDLITPPEGERIGNTPVHRFDGDGWGIYIPIQAWYSSTDALENQWLWRSSYNTGSMLTVDVCSHTLEDEYVTAELQGYTPADRTNRIWELHIDDIHSYYYYYENPDGGFWRVTIGWTEEAITDYPAIAIEPQMLKLMAESFVVYSNAKSAVNTITSPIYRCNILENTAIHGESTITFPDGFGSFELYSCKVILCDDNCDPYSVVFRQFWGYAGGWPLEPAAEYEVSDRWKYPTRLYLCTVPEENLENMRGTPEQIEAYGNRRAYLYLMTLSENLYAYICVKPPEDINTTPAPENERELADMLVSGAQIAVFRQNLTETMPAEQSTLEQRFDELNLYREGKQFRAIQSLLNHDSTSLEQAMNLPAGTGQMFTDITISSWAISRLEDNNYYNPVLLTLDITESNSEIVSEGISQWVVDEGLDGVTLKKYYELSDQYTMPDIIRPNPATDAETAVWTWLRATGQIILPLNHDMTEDELIGFRYAATEYACRHSDGTLDSIREMVKLCFGSAEYYTDEILYSEDGIHYGVGGHGAARHVYDWLDETQNADGSISVRMLFYVDAGKYIPAREVEYTLLPVMEDSYGQTVYSFVSCTVTKDYGYPPFFKWT
ncbi:MAG: hypothetical protein IJP32_00685, partial [Clostridia bacterium]|nr:hypothetical protein [Clostridia bacterium]